MCPLCFCTGQKTLFAAKDRRRSSDGKHNRQTNQPFSTLHNNSQHGTFVAQNRKKRNIYSKPAFGRTESNGKSHDKSFNKTDRFESGILVRENTRTVKVDNTSALQCLKTKKLINKTNSDGQLKTQRRRSCHRTGSAETRKTCDTETSAVSHNGNGVNDNTSQSSNLTHSLNANSASSLQTKKSPSHEERTRSAPLTPAKTQWKGSSEQVHARSSERAQGRSDSIVSSYSTASECQSTFSTSDITLNMQSGLSRENSFKRPKSAPGTFVRNASSGSLPNMIINNFIASSPDNFRSYGAWRFMVEYKGKWESK